MKLLLIIFLAATTFALLEARRPRRQATDPCSVILCDNGERCARVSPSCTSSNDCVVKGVCVANEMYQQQYSQYQQYQQPQYQQQGYVPPYPVFQPNAFQQAQGLFGR